MSLSINAYTSNVSAGEIESLSTSLTTTANDIVIVVFITTPQVNDSAIVTMSDSANSITWIDGASTPYFVQNDGTTSGAVWAFVGTTTSILSSDSITITTSSVTIISTQIVAVEGGNLSSPLDSSALTTGTNSSNVTSATSSSFSTSNSNELILFMVGGGGGSTGPTAGLIGGAQSSLTGSPPSNGAWTFSEYLVVSSTQSSITASMSWSSGSNQNAYGTLSLIQGPTMVPAIIYSSESETYTFPVSISQPISYTSESETYSFSVFISQPISYTAESETYSISEFLIIPSLAYKEYENYSLEAKADVTIHYSENETYSIGLIYDVPTITYSNQQSQYVIFENATLGTSTGYLTNNISVHIPVDSSSYITSTKYTLNSTYLPPNTNVSSVSASDIITVDFNFNFTITLSVSSTTVTATIEDLDSNPIPNIVVSWTATGGTVSPTQSTTNSSGQATTIASASSGVTVTATATILGVTNSESVSA